MYLSIWTDGTGADQIRGKFWFGQLIHLGIIGQSTSPELETGVQILVQAKMFLLNLTKSYILFALAITTVNIPLSIK